MRKRDRLKKLVRLQRQGNRNFSEAFFPARPKKLLTRAKEIANKEIDTTLKIGPAVPSNKAYIRWLRKESMLANANKQARRYSGTAKLWQKPFAKPRPRSAVRQASVWYTAYPVSMIGHDSESMLATFADDKLWDAFATIGIKGLHTGPMKKAGGIQRWKQTMSIDGHFDRISNKIDPLFGSEAEFIKLTQTAAKHGGIIIDDIVPGHTGKGTDFLLACMADSDYPGIYHMVEIEEKDWDLLPNVPKNKDSVNISTETEAELKKHGYIVGKLQRVIFYEPGVKETNWSATKEIVGVDGIGRRWVYLHYFKDGQPSINWLDPSFAGMKLVIGDALHSLGDLGSKGLRLDANGFLGIEVSDSDSPAWSEGHPLSQAANQLIASMVRKTGGFTFQELNLSIDDIKTMSRNGADLSYDFISRPAYHHALATGDTEFLRMMLNLAAEHEIDAGSLVHALQNHDELTYELVHFWGVHKDELFEFRGKHISGSSLRSTIQQELKQKLTGDKITYNLTFTENGIACTTATVIAAVLGYETVDSLNEQQMEQIKKIHLLLAMFNAMQPGVFALSGWDLSGSLTLDKTQVEELIQDGDTRWIHRGAYDLMDKNPGKTVSNSGMPKAINLYGPLPTQLLDPGSFASRLKKLLELRERYGIATAHQIDIPDVSHPAMLVMVHKFTDTTDLQVSVLNFGSETIIGDVISHYFQPGSVVINIANDKQAGVISSLYGFTVDLAPYDGQFFVIKNSN